MMELLVKLLKWINGDSTAENRYIDEIDTILPYQIWRDDAWQELKDKETENNARFWMGLPPAE